MGARGLPPPDDSPTVDLGPRAPTDEQPAIDDDLASTESLADPYDPGLPRGNLGFASPTRASGSGTASPVEAMRVDELERTRVFIKAVLAICIGGTVVALAAAGDPGAQEIVLGGTSLALVGSLGLHALTRDPQVWEPRRVLPWGLLIVAGSMSGVYYWGVGSPIAALLVYGVYFFSLGSSARIITGIYALIAVVHGALAAGIMAGVLEDRGVIRMSGLRVWDQLAIVAIIEVLYFIAFSTARASQRVTLETMSKLEAAARTVAQRDAMLAEARAELDRALVVGGPGRFTEQTVGSFQLGVLIGRGGMGEVYEARHVGTGAAAAVK